jgi:cell division cycle 2-like
MSAKPKSRWAQDDEEDAIAEAQRRCEKEEKKRLKAEKQRQLEAEKASAAVAAHPSQADSDNRTNGDSERPAKRRRLSQGSSNGFPADRSGSRLLQFSVSGWGPCRHVDNFEKLNHIEEGSYGWVSRAKESATGEIVALKKLKMENSGEGFPVTGLREIQTLLEARHPNIVYLREIVMGNSRNEYVFDLI